MRHRSLSFRRRSASLYIAGFGVAVAVALSSSGCTGQTGNAAPIRSSQASKTQSLQVRDIQNNAHMPEAAKRAALAAMANNQQGHY